MLRSVLFAAAAFACSQAFSFPAAFKLSPGVDTRGFRDGLHLCKMTAAEPKVVVFTQEMRQAAMSLHTFSQAPKEGKVKDVSSETQVEQWQTTKEDFLQFLVDSKAVYEAFEKAVERPELQSLKNTGEIQDCKLFRLSSSSELFFFRIGASSSSRGGHILHYGQVSYSITFRHRKLHNFSEINRCSSTPLLFVIFIVG